MKFYMAQSKLTGWWLYRDGVPYSRVNPQYASLFVSREEIEKLLLAVFNKPLSSHDIFEVVITKENPCQ